MSRFSPARSWHVGTVFLLVLIVSPMRAQTIVWALNTGQQGIWQDPNNWSPTGTPNNAKDVVIGTGGSVAIGNALEDNAATARSIKISGGTLAINHSSLYTTADSVIGDTASANVTVNSSSLWSHTANLSVKNGSSFSVGSNSTVVIRNDLNLNQGTLHLSNNGTFTVNGTVTLSGSSNTIDIAQIAGQAKPGTLDTSSVIASPGASGLVTFNHISNNYTFSPSLSGNISIEQNGAGSTTILAGNNTHTGSTTINAGTLQVGDGGTSGSLGSGAVVVSSSGTLAFNRSDDLTVSNLIGGSGTLTKNGAGTLTLSGANYYNGATTINAGTLQSGANNVLPDSSFFTVNSGATLDLNNFSDTIRGLAGSGNVNLGLGTLTLAPTDGSDVTFSGVISGTGGLTRNSSLGTLILSGNNTYSGPTVIKDFGTLQVGAGGASGAIVGDALLGFGSALIFNRSTDFSYSGKISGNGTLTKLGAGSLTLGGDNTYIGVTTISGGSIILSGGSNRLGPSANLLITNGSMLDLGGFSQNIAGLSSSSSPVVGNIRNGTLNLGNSGGNIYLQSGTFNDVTFNGGNDNARLWIGGDANATVTLNGTNNWVYGSDHHQVVIGYSTTGAAGTVKVGKAESLAADTETIEVWSGTLDLNGVSDVRGLAIQLKSGANSSLINDNTSSDASFVSRVTIDPGSTIGGAGNLTLSGFISGNTLTKVGTGMLTISDPSNTFGSTNISGGTLRLSGGANRLGHNSNVSVTNGAALDLGGNSQGVSNLNVAGDLNNGTIALNVGGAVYLQSGTVSNVTFTNGNNTNSRLWIGGDPDASVTLNGTNNMTYASDHNQVIIGFGGGAGAVNGVYVGNPNALAAATENVEVHYGRLDLNGVSNVRAGSIQLKQGGNSALINDNTGSAASFAGPVGLAQAGSVIGGAGTLTLSGNITGDGGWFKSGGGTLKLTGNNTYTGNTTLSNGTLELGGNNVLGSGTLTISGGEIRAADAARTVSNPLTLSGSFAVGRLTNFSGNVSLSENVTITARNSDGPANGDNNFNGVISGAKSITIAEGSTGIGSGSIYFNANNTYTGGTILNSGRLTVDHDAALGAAGSGLTLNGGTLVTTLGVNSTHPLTLGGAATIDVAFGTTTFDAVSGSGSLTKNGTGTTLALSGSSLHTGATTVNAGSLLIGTGGTIANLTGNVAIASGASLTLNHSNSSGIAGVISGTGSLTKAGSGTLTLTGNSTHTGSLSVTGGALQVGNGGTSGSLSSNIVLSSGTSATFNRSDNSTYSGAASGAGGLTKSGAGTLTLSNNNTYGGGTSVTGGTLQLGSGGTSGMVSGNVDLSIGSTLSFNRSDNISYGGVVSGIGSLTKLGAGSLTLNNTQTFTGNTNISGGSLILSGANRLPTTSTVYITNDATLDLGGGSHSVAALGSASNRIVGNIGNGTVSTGTSNVFLQNGTITATFTGNSSAERLWIGGDANAMVTLNGTNDMVFQSDHNQVIIGHATTGGAGTVKVGNANALAAATENVEVWSGTLDLNGVSGVRGNSIQLKSGSASALLNNNTGSAASFAGGIGLASAGSVLGGAGDLALSGNLTGAGGLNKTGAGTLTLSGSNNNYSGGTTLTAGILGLGADNVLGTGTLNIYGGNIRAVNAARTVTNNVTLAGSFTLGRSTTFSGPVTLTDNIVVTSSNPGGASGGATSTLSGNISGGFGLTFTEGTIPIGTIALTGTNNYTGGTTLNAGTLAINNNASLGTGTLTLNGTSTLRVNAAITLPNAIALTGTNPIVDNNGLALGLGGNISGSAAVTLSGAGTTTLTGAANHTGGTTVAGGTLQLGNGGTSGTLGGNVAVTNGGSLAFNRSDDSTSSSVISGSGSVAKNGTGRVILSSNNTYTGGTTLNAGTLGLGANNALGTGTVVINGGNIRAEGAPRTLTNNVTLAGNFTLGRATNFAGPLTLANNIVITSANPDVFGGSASTLSGAISGPFGLTFTEGTNPIGLIVLSGNNSYTGGTTLNAGILSVGSNASLGTGALTLNGTSTLLAGASVTLPNAIALTGSSATIDNNGLALGLNGKLSGASTVTFSGSGTTTLAGINTYTGTTNLTAGSLLLSGGADRLPTSSSVFISNGATLNLGGNSQTVATLGSSSNRIVGNVTNGTLSTNAGHVFLQSGAFGATFTGSSSNSRIWIGGDANATVTLNGTNDMVFTTDHNQMIIGHAVTGAAGTVRLGNPNALAAATENVEIWSGTIDFNGQGNVRGNSILLKSGSLSSLLNSTGAASFAGSVSLDSGISQVGGSGDLSLGGAISGSGGLNKTGLGRLTLGSVSTYSGGTTITAGTLQLGASNRLASTGALTLAGGTFATGGFNQTLGTLNLSASSTIDFGNGASALNFASSAASWTGTLSILNYTDGQDTLRIGTSSNSLTATQLNQISFGGLLARIDANGFVSPMSAIPEPSTYAALAGLVALSLAAWRRRQIATTARRSSREFARSSSARSGSSHRASSSN